MQVETANAPHRDTGLGPPARRRAPARRVISANSRWRQLRILAAALALSITTLGASVAVATPASAHGVEVNGCTGVPDAGYGFDFHELCDEHDRCYGVQPHGSGWRGRRSCDRAFRSDMLGYCDRHGRLSAKRAACKGVAVAYYTGVRAFGRPFWEAAEPTPVV